MCKQNIFFLFLLFLFSMTSFSQTQPPIEPGVSHELAIWRAKHYSDVRYKLNLTLEKMSPILKGEIEIRVKFSDTENINPGDQVIGGSDFKFILDWRKIRGSEDSYLIQNITLNDKKAKYKEANEHIIIDNAIAGENIIKLEFTSPISTSGSAITRYIDKEDGSEYIYSLFVPSDASTAFPCFDQPDLKARFQLKVDSHFSWKVISNSKAKENTFFDTKRSLQTTRFEETQPISTYVFAFAAGNFEEVSEGGNCEGACGNLND
jgi:aminopeptidase N